MQLPIELGPSDRLGPLLLKHPERQAIAIMLTSVDIPIETKFVLKYSLDLSKVVVGFLAWAHYFELIELKKTK